MQQLLGTLNWVCLYSLCLLIYCQLFHLLTTGKHPSDIIIVTSEAHAALSQVNDILASKCVDKFLSSYPGLYLFILLTYASGFQGALEVLQDTKFFFSVNGYIFSHGQHQNILPCPDAVLNFCV